LASSVNEYSAHVKELELRVKQLAAELDSFRTGDRPHHANGPDETNEIAEPRPLHDPAISAGSAILEPPSPETDS